MSFRSLDHVISALQEQNKWQDQPLQHLLKYWSEAVGAVVAAHTRPFSIQRDVLWVATSSAAWAQNLTFERQRILQKLNPLMPSPLIDIRFSTARWQSPQYPKLTQPKTNLQQHPSFLKDVPRIPDPPVNSNNPNATFQHWAQVMQARSQDLPLCPQCQCPTPLGELQRWTICAICAAKQS